MDNLKAEQIGSTRWRVLAIPFGGPKDGRDTDEEWFDHATDIKARWFGDERPVIWHHDQDPATHRKDRQRDEPDDSELGIETDLAEAKDGWWGTLWLERSNRYWAQIDQWLREGKAYGSSGAIGHMVRKSRNGHIDVWPHAEQTITLTPANPYARITVAKAMAGFNSAGIELDASVLDELDARSDDLTPDLSNGGESDLSLGGDEAAMKRLVALTNAQLARLRAL